MCVYMCVYIYIYILASVRCQHNRRTTSLILSITVLSALKVVLSYSLYQAPSYGLCFLCSHQFQQSWPMWACYLFLKWAVLPQCSPLPRINNTLKSVNFRGHHAAKMELGSCEGNWYRIHWYHFSIDISIIGGMRLIHWPPWRHFTDSTIWRDCFPTCTRHCRPSLLTSVISIPSA